MTAYPAHCKRLVAPQPPHDWIVTRVGDAVHYRCARCGKTHKF